MRPAKVKHQYVVHKDYVIDYTSPLRRIIMESESGSGGLSYRYMKVMTKTRIINTFSMIMWKL